jgi:CRP/FNR family cyclic AMP-dependent transcriptional regulator
MAKPGSSHNQRSEADLRHLHRIGTLCAVKPGCALTTEGLPGRDAFYVVEGTARVTTDGLLLAQVGPDQFVGEMALIDHGPRSASVVADSPMQVLAFDATAFSVLLDDRRLARSVQRQLVERLRATQLSTPSNQTHNRRS